MPERKRGPAIAAVAAAVAGVSAGVFFWPRPAALSPSELDAFARQYCADCHNEAERAGDFDFARLDAHDFGADRARWEKVARKLRVGMMPPADAASPPKALRDTVVASLEAGLDALAAETPDPGPALVRRLNR